MALLSAPTDSLNPEQRAAVEHGRGPLLVLAGAGSGKTRVLTARVARLASLGVAPDRILAFTFTNRAAREMRERIERSMGDGARRAWIGTFHATAVRVLRREAGTLGLPPEFVIYDRDDQESVLKDVLREVDRTDEPAKPGAVLSRISDAKNALVTPAELAARAFQPAERRIADAYARYQVRLRANGALDFDDLIAETTRLLRDFDEARARWAGRFEHVLVDEYQDTNHAQFRLIELLAKEHGNLFVVGDDDQSIYGWRGADLSNVLDFERAFPGARVLRLEQNYRSCSNILKAANAVIANNRGRKGKNLWSEREDGERLRFVLAGDEVEEARRVRAVLAEHARRGGALADCAVLYRTNSQSRALEAELRQNLMPYEIVGGVSFYQRREVKDLLAYLRVAVNPADGVSFWRIWNTPRRGLGASVKARVEFRTLETRESPEAALRALVAEGALTRQAEAGARQLLETLDALRGLAAESVDRVVAELLDRTHYLDSLIGEDDGDERRANVEELAASAAHAAATREANLVDFLAETALLTDLDRVEESADRVLLMTVHNAKGLEFRVVVVAGLEEGLFPHGASIEDGPGLEEERRLFYVAVTRAADRVVLTAAAFRRRFDGARGAPVSRFVDEIPAELLEREESAGAGARRSEPRPERRREWRWGEGGGEAGEERAPRIAWSPPPPVTRHRAVGKTVYHESFGRGVVTAVEGDGPEGRYTVRFGTTIKKVLGRFLSGSDDGADA